MLAHVKMRGSMERVKKVGLGGDDREIVRIETRDSLVWFSVERIEMRKRDREKEKRERQREKERCETRELKFFSRLSL